MLLVFCGSTIDEERWLSPVMLKFFRFDNFFMISSWNAKYEGRIPFEAHLLE